MDLREKMRKRIQAHMPRAGGWYEIKAVADADTAVIRIYDEISWFGVTADDFARDLSAVSASQIEVQINSPGGDVFDGLAIYNSLRAHPARITVRVDGIAASAASAIAQAGDHRIMMSSAQMMIHEAHGIAIGPAAEMRAFADILDQQNDIMARLYANRAGGDVDTFRSLMAAETWLTDATAVELGLADEVMEPERKSAPAQEPSPLTAAVRAELARLGISMGAIPSHDTAVREGSGDCAGYRADAGNERDVLRHVHAWVNPDGDPQAKASYKFPHHPSEPGSAADLVCVRNALARLGQADIPDADRAAVARHLQNHLDAQPDNAARSGSVDEQAARTFFAAFNLKEHQ